MKDELRPFECPYCEVCAKTKEALYTHIEVQHPGQRKRVKNEIRKTHR